MAKANLTLPDGTKVAIEGSAEEVASLLNTFSQAQSSRATPTTRKKSSRKASSKKRAPSKARASDGSRKKSAGPTGYILELRDSGFFKERRTLPDIQKKLEELGHIYAQTSLSSPLIRLVKKRELRRLKEKKGWAYVK